MRIEKNAFFCIGGLSSCENTLEAVMRCDYDDGTSSLYETVRMTGSETKAANAAYYDKSGELWISLKEKNSPYPRGIKLIELTFRDPGGDIERLCLSAGTAAFDPESRNYRVRWLNGVLRHDKITIVPDEDGAEITFSTIRSVKASEPAAAAVSLKKKPVSAEALRLTIDTDLGILGFYGGDRSENAKELLKKARELTENADATPALNEAQELTEKAELYIRECVISSMADVHAYREETQRP